MMNANHTGGQEMTHRRIRNLLHYLLDARIVCGPVEQEVRGILSALDSDETALTEADHKFLRSIQVKVEAS